MLRSLNIILLILLPIGGFAQDVYAIQFEGLERTKESYIRQFILTKTGEHFDSLKAEQDRQRLANLEIMGSVILSQSRSTAGVTLTFTCHEMINIIPVFALGQSRPIRCRCSNGSRIHWPRMPAWTAGMKMCKRFRCFEDCHPHRMRKRTSLVWVRPSTTRVSCCSS